MALAHPPRYRRTMDVSNWINLALAALSAASVAIAIHSAVGSRRAAKESLKHELSALAASRELAEANGRAAAALEDANQLRRAALPTTPLVLVQKTKSEWRVVNRSSQAVTDVRVECPAAPGEITFPPGGQPPFAILQPEESVSFWHEASLATPPNLSVEISWRDEHGDVGGTVRRRL